MCNPTVRLLINRFIYNLIYFIFIYIYINTHTNKQANIPKRITFAHNTPLVRLKPSTHINQLIAASDRHKHSMSSHNRSRNIGRSHIEKHNICLLPNSYVTVEQCIVLARNQQ